jgi:DNA-binding response OmpR family regulator
VGIAYDGRTAENVEELDWHLVMLDIMLPQLSGIEICRRIWVGSQISIVMLTFKDVFPDRVSGLDAGAYDITNSFTIEELGTASRNRMAAHLRGRAENDHHCSDHAPLGRTQSGGTRLGNQVDDEGD